MSRTNFEQLLEAGCHFGHLRRKWNPAMAPYIFMERNGIHIIDLHKTVAAIDQAAEVLKRMARDGKKILFVGTKKQIKEIVAERVSAIGMPYVIERWPGGMLTNFPTIRKAVKKMTTIDKLTSDGTYSNLSKREILQITRQRAKLEKNLGSIADLSRLPAALFVIDVLKENIAVREANRLGIPVFAIVDTNSDPAPIDYVIPANDDATKSVDIILTACCNAIAEGLEERKAEKGEEAAVSDEEKTERPRRERIRRVARSKRDKSFEDAPEDEDTSAKAEKAPAKAKSEKAPAKTKVEEAPAKEKKVEDTPAKEKAEDAPTKEKVEDAPAKAKAEEAPAKEKAEDAPAKAKAEKAPAKEKKVEDTPAKEKAEEAPAKEKAEKAPAKAKVEDAPAKAKVEDAPAKAKVEDAPAEDKEAEA
jgi:small subunit ribosomal protein S2